jgi:GGDEF domain-containing protein
MADGSHGAHRPRPVAGVAPDRPADGVAVARAWLLGVMAAVPLADAGDVPVADLAAEGPRLCAALLEAVASDAALERLAPGGDLEGAASGAARLAGARDPAGAAAAVARLRDALWRELSASVPREDAAFAIALSERVAHVADVVTAAVLRSPIEAALRSAEEPWSDMVRRAVAAHGRDGAPVSVLVVEAQDADRLAVAGDTDAAALERFEAAVGAAVREGDQVARERAGRLWVIARGLDAEGARALAGRLAEAGSAAASPHGAPLAAAAGVATCPSDATTPETLAELADERLFAARAAGVPVA